MIDFLKSLDQQIFIFLNSLNSPFWDDIMYNISEKYIWIPFYLFLIMLVVDRYKKKAVWIILFTIASVSLADMVSVNLFKEVFERLRPCHEPALQDIVHLVNNHCGGKFGFVSSHASNTFALAVFLAFFLGKRSMVVMIITWAIVVSYSRIYLGVHYPGDVLGGALLGSLIAALLFQGYRKLFDGAGNQLPDAE